jgi:hypothetical protein
MRPWEFVPAPGPPLAAAMVEGRVGVAGKSACCAESKRMVRVTEFDPSAFLDNDEVVAAYLTAALEDANPDSAPVQS